MGERITEVSETHYEGDYSNPPSPTENLSSASEELLPKSSCVKQSIPRGRRAQHTIPSPTNSSSSDSETGQWRSIKKRLLASGFKKEDMSDLNILYDEQPMPIDCFFKMLKEKKQWTMSTVVEEEILGTFKQANEDQLENLNMDLETITKTAEMHFETKNEDSDRGRRNRHAFNDLKRNTLDCMMNEAQRVNKFYRKIVINGQYTGDTMIRLFGQWAASVNEFLQSCVDLVRSIFHPVITPKISHHENHENEKERDPCEKIYHTLFMSFSKICLLHPRPHRKTYGIFRNKVIMSEPDIHFVQTFTPYGADGSPVLIMNCEVKREDHPDKRRPMKTWIENIISSNVLGKIGTELLIESYGSFFSPYAVGIVCLRSEIMFLFLDISIDHFDAITESLCLDGKRASIHYTKSYDILKQKDRSEIMDIMFYMAAIQTYNFLFPF